MFSSSLFSSSRVFSIRFSWKLSFTLFKRYTLSSFNCTIIYFFVTPTSINYNSSIPYIFWTLSSRSEFVLYLDNYVIWSFVIVSLSTSLSGQQVNSCDWRWQTLWSGSQTVNPLGMSTGIWRAEDWSQWTSSQGSGRSVWVKLGAKSWRSLSCGWQGNNPRLHMGQSSWREGWKQAPRGGIHAMRLIWAHNSQKEDWGFLLIDAWNAFNEENRTATLWSVWNNCTSGAQFKFKCYWHWDILVVRDLEGSNHFLHSKEGTIQGYPLDMITYGIEVFPLIQEIRNAPPPHQSAMLCWWHRGRGKPWENNITL